MTISKSTNINANIKEAQYRTTESLARFEKAMDHLADKVDQTSGKIHHYRGIMQAPKKLYRRASKQMDRAFEKTLRPIKENPSPFVVGVLGLLAAVAIVKAAQLKSNC